MQCKDCKMCENGWCKVLATIVCIYKEACDYGRKIGAKVNE